MQIGLQGIPIREFARRDGCSDTLVHRAIKQGKLFAFDDGSIDPRLVGTPWRKHKGEVRPANGGLESFAEAQRKKENFLALLRQLEFEIKSGRLVEMAVVERELDKQGRIVRDHIASWPARIGALIAAKFGIDQVAFTIELERHVRELLSAVANPEFRGKSH